MGSLLICGRGERDALERGWEALRGGAGALDVVENVVRLLEDDLRGESVAVDDAVLVVVHDLAPTATWRLLGPVRTVLPVRVGAPRVREAPHPPEHGERLPEPCLRFG